MENMQSGARILNPGADMRGKRGISGSTVKIIAVIAMLIDHIAAVILTRQFMAEGYMGALAGGESRFQEWIEQNSGLYFGNMIMRMIGRLGFPIFCFLLAEGFQRSRDVKKYAFRLGIFALVSEIPFDLATTGNVWNPGYQNVYFTLFLGLMAMCTYRFFAGWEEGGKEDLPAGVRWALTVMGMVAAEILILMLLQSFAEFGYGTESQMLFSLVLLAPGLLGLVAYGTKKGFRRVQTICADLTALVFFMVIAELLRTDYGGMGVMTISAMYLFRKSKVKAMLAGCVVLNLLSLSELPAFLALLPVALYDGRRGLKMKYFFYAFYPVHLALLYLAAVLLGLGEIILIYS